MNIRPNGRTMLAHVTLWLDMGIVVRGVQLHNKNGKYFIVWPQMVTSQGERYDTVYPDSKDKTEKILSEIVARYETLVSEETNEDNEMESGNDGKEITRGKEPIKRSISICS